jgi:hypothetical protein
LRDNEWVTKIAYRFCLGPHMTRNDYKTCRTVVARNSPVNQTGWQYADTQGECEKAAAAAVVAAGDAVAAAC